MTGEVATMSEQPIEAREYFSRAGLSNSGMRDLAISPLRYWFHHINPARPEVEPTPEMQIGSALHCAVLEPQEFNSRYGCKIQVEDYDGCLVTIDDIRQWIKDKGGKPSGTRKADLVTQAQAMDANVPIWDVLQSHHARENAGKVLFSMDDWLRVQRAAESLKAEPRVRGILAEGEAEVSLFATSPGTGIPLKARLDWVNPGVTLDLKTFSCTRGKSIDRAITDAIWYEGYYRQAYFYSWLRMLNNTGTKQWPTFVFAFVESDEPHEIRIRSMRPTYAGQPNLLWDRARIEVNGLIARYFDYWQKYGESPWRDQREVEPIVDEEMPQLAYSV